MKLQTRRVYGIKKGGGNGGAQVTRSRRGSTKNAVGKSKQSSERNEFYHLRLEIVTETETELLEEGLETGSVSGSWKEVVEEKKPASASTHDDASCIPIIIPGVKLVLDYEDEETAPFTRPEKYIKHIGDELSKALSNQKPNYDMDSQDDEWLNVFNTRSTGNTVSEDTFEMIIDVFEKGHFHHPKAFSTKKLPEPDGLCSELCSREVAQAVYSNWRKKKIPRKGSQQLLHVFDAYKTRKFPKYCKLVPMVQRPATDSTELPRRRRRKNSKASVFKPFESRAQVVMENADLIMYKATMALRIAETAQLITEQPSGLSASFSF